MAFFAHCGDRALVRVVWKPKRRQARTGWSSGATSRPRRNTRSTKVP